MVSGCTRVRKTGEKEAAYHHGSAGELGDVDEDAV
jgi:hypothetical protein